MDFPWKVPTQTGPTENRKLSSMAPSYMGPIQRKSLFNGAPLKGEHNEMYAAW